MVSYERNVGMDTADRLGLGCGMPGTPRLVIGYLQRKGQIARPVYFHPF